MRLSAGMRNEIRKQGFGHLTIGADSLDLKEMEKYMPKEFIGVVKRAEEHNKDSLGQLQEVPMEFLPIVLTNESSKNPAMVSIYNGVMDRRNPYSIPVMGNNIPNIDALANDSITREEAGRYQSAYNRLGAERDRGYGEDDKPIYVNGDENGDPRDDYVQDKKDQREEAEAYAQALIAEEEARRANLEAERAAREASERALEEDEDEYEYGNR